MEGFQELDIVKVSVLHCMTFQSLRDSGEDQEEDMKPMCSVQNVE